jgi:chemotaxis protein CheD
MGASLEIAESVKVMVRIAELAASKDPATLFYTFPLGSGLGIAVYDAEAKVGGILHSVLPSSSIDPDQAATTPGMFLDTGLQLLFAQMRQLNANIQNLRVAVAGAAQIMDDEPVFNVGKSNIDALMALLAQVGLEVHAKSVGGKTNCNMEFNVGTGEIRVKYCGQPEAQVLCKPSASI